MDDKHRRPQRRATEDMPEFVVLEGAVMTARQWRMQSFQRRTAVTLIGLAAASRLLRSRGFYALIILGVIELKAISQTSRKELAASLEVVMRWQNKRLAEYVEERHQHKASASAQGVS